LIRDLVEGQYWHPVWHPVRIVVFNTAEGWSRNVTFELYGEAVILGVDGVSDFTCIRVGMTTKSSSAHSTSSSKATTICASCRCTFARRTLNGYWRAGRRASSSIHLSARRGRAGPIPRRMRHGSRRARLKTPRPALSGRQVEALD